MLGKCSALSPAGNGGARNSQNPQGEQFHTGILTPLSSFCVSLNAFGEEPWSFPQGYTEVSEVSTAVCWGEDAATHRQHHRHSQSVPGVFVSACNLRGREALSSPWCPTLDHLLLQGQLYLPAHPPWAV